MAVGWHCSFAVTRLTMRCDLWRCIDRSMASYILIRYYFWIRYFTPGLCWLHCQEGWHGDWKWKYAYFVLIWIRTYTLVIYVDICGMYTMRDLWT